MSHFKTTSFQDIIDEMPHHVISPPGSPTNWGFTERESSLATEPPRPNSASQRHSPPVERRVGSDQILYKKVDLV